MKGEFYTYRIIYILMLLFFINGTLSSQSINIQHVDSLKQKLLFSQKNDRIDIYLQLTQLSISNNELTKAESFCRNALNLSDEINCEYEKAISLKYLGEINFLKNEYRNAINIFLEGFSENGELLNDYEKSELYYLLGSSYFQIYYFEKSLVAGFKAINNIQDTSLLFYKTLCLLSCSYFQLEEFINAIKFQKESLKVAYLIQDSTLICAQLNEIGLSLLELNKIDSAKKYFRKALFISDEINCYHYSSAIFDNLGEIFYKQKNIDSALFYFNNALDIRKKIKYYWGIGNTSTNIGKIYLEKENYSKAKKYLKNGEKNLKKHTDDLYKNIGLLKNYKLQSELFEKEAYTELAFNYYKLYNNLNNNLNNKEVKIRYAKIKAKHETIQLQTNLLNYKRSNSKKNYQLLIAIIFGISILIISIVLIYILIRRINGEKKLLIEKTNKFEQEIDLKNRELLCSVHSIYTKNYIIGNIAKKLSDSLGDFKNANYPLINYVINELKQTMDETGWKEFEIYFSKVHQLFYENLNKRHPNLSNSEKRLCALIKLEMTNKEIAALTMTKHESVHTARSRLRKKLNLDGNSNISEFLNSI